MSGRESKKPAGTCRLVMLGSPGVGKTERVYHHRMSMGRDNIQLEIMDTAGQPYSTSVGSYVAWGDCFVFVYSLTEDTTFSDLITLRQAVEGARQTPAVHALVANKADLDHLRKVPTSEGRRLAKDWGCAFYEVSAADGHQVEMIASVFNELYSQHRQLVSPGTNCNNHKDSPAGTRFRKAIQKVVLGRRIMGTKSQHKSDS